MKRGTPSVAKPAPLPPLPPAFTSGNQTRSRRLLLVVAAVIFAIWVAMMLVMYFTTVYPHRYPATSPIPNFAP
jgi:hypothetical protein